MFLKLKKKKTEKIIFHLIKIKIINDMINSQNNNNNSIGRFMKIK